METKVTPDLTSYIEELILNVIVLAALLVTSMLLPPFFRRHKLGPKMYIPSSTGNGIPCPPLPLGSAYCAPGAVQGTGETAVSGTGWALRLESYRHAHPLECQGQDGDLAAPVLKALLLTHVTASWAPRGDQRGPAPSPSSADSLGENKGAQCFAPVVCSLGPAPAPSPQVVSQPNPKSLTREADTEERGCGPGREVTKGSSFNLQLLGQIVTTLHPISSFAD